VKTWDVVRVTGVTYKQINRWTRDGLVTATYWRGDHDPQEADAGSGKRCRYAETEVSVIEAMATLCRLGLGPRAAAPIARRSVEDMVPLKDALTAALQAVTR
jgi:hypothetical protein